MKGLMIKPIRFSGGKGFVQLFVGNGSMTEIYYDSKGEILNIDITKI